MHDESTTTITEQLAAAGFGWCGGCATGFRSLTTDEARRLLTIPADADPLDYLHEISWLVEIQQRVEFRGPCECGPLVVVAGAPRVGFFVYRLWDAHGRLLYVGSSAALNRRLRRHRAMLGELIARATWDEYYDAATMLAGERDAIANEMPALNKASV